MGSTRPTIVLIPGSFCSAALLWDAVVDELHDAGYETLAVELRTVGPPSTSPPKTMADDAEHIHGIIEALANDGKDVLVVMSSFGGIPGTQAVKNLTRKEQQEDGKTGGVTGLVYASALLINEGESSEDSFAPFTIPHTSHDFFKISVRGFPASKTKFTGEKTSDSDRANIFTSTPSEAQLSFFQTCQSLWARH
jgi:pimeloyl-ACP methyl ester carboxylesterase